MKLLFILLIGIIYLPVVIQVDFGTPTQMILPSDIVLDIVRQPIDDPTWVSIEEDKVTLFNMALDYNSYGLLAHDYLAGKHFKNLGLGQHIRLVDENNRQKLYTIVDFQEYQAISPQSVYSDFIDLQTGNRLTVEQVFMRTFGVPDRAVLQTSIFRYGIEAWGRLFIIALPDKVLDIKPMIPNSHYIPIYTNNVLLRGKYLVY